MADSRISDRKAQHIAIARDQDVGFHQNGTLLEAVVPLHEALPELSMDDIDTSVQVLGKRLRVPLLIAAMTGGSSESQLINQQLAQVAQDFGCGLGLGSQRAMLVNPALTSTYQVRQQAPDALLLGNLGIVQARSMSAEQVGAMLEAVGADALCLHMNPAMEVVQPEGDRDFRGCLATFERLVSELKAPVIAKETGCGISFHTAQRLRAVGVSHVDVSGAGGTSWVAVETLRAQGLKRSLGELLREWGIPTAASIAMVHRAGMQTVIATGGIHTGLDIARAVMLGASAAGIARPVLQALGQGGTQGAHQYLAQVEQELKAVMMLVGARNIQALRRVPRILDRRLSDWLSLCQEEEA